MDTLVFNDVTKVFAPKKKKPVTAVDRFSLTVSQGDMIVLLGPSGCGKTPLLRMIAGLDAPSAGDLLLNGADLKALPAHKRPVAMVFQNYALYPHMTARQNLTYALSVKKTPKEEIRRRFTETCEILKLDADLLGRKPETLSGGQRQRVALGRAIMQRPKVFLLDEPFSNLDQNLRMHLRIQIRKIQKALNLTVIMVTHDQGDALAMGDRIVLMDRGHIVQVAPPKTLYDHPETLFAATFLGWPPMNRIPGRIHAHGNETIFIQDDGPLRVPLSRPVDGDRVVLGIRPEHVRVTAVPEPKDAPGLCVDEEMVGLVRYAHARCGADTLTGIAGEGISPGSPVRFDLAPDHAHLFDPETGRVRK